MLTEAWETFTEDNLQNVWKKLWTIEADQIEENSVEDKRVEENVLDVVSLLLKLMQFS